MVKFLQSKQTRLFILIAVIIVILDQIVKFLVQKFQPNLDFLFFHIVMSKNTGAGFGILQGQTILLSIISLIVTGLIIYYYPRFPKQTFPQILLALFLGGTIGNLIDRFFRGYVIDFIGTYFWPSFNIADSMISISAVGLIIYFIREEFISKKKEK